MSKLGGYAKVKEWRSRPEAKAMRAAEARRYRAKHPDKAKAIKEAYRQRNREEILPKEAEKARRRRAADPEGQRQRYAKWTAKRHSERENKAGRPRPTNCEICGGNGKIVFDHCHGCDQFRGWICDTCNKVLGLVKDQTLTLLRMAAYIETHWPNYNLGTCRRGWDSVQIESEDEKRIAEFRIRIASLSQIPTQ